MVEFEVFLEASVSDNKNCEKLLELIIQKQQGLKGKKIIYKRPYFVEISSRLNKIKMANDILTIITEGENNKRKLNFEFDVEEIRVSVNPESKTISFFRGSNLGKNFTEEIIIFFSLS